MREEMRKMAEGKDKVYERLAERMAQTNNIKPNHAVGEVYKPNIHDPHEMYRWQDEEASAPCLGVGDACTGYTWILCGYLYAHFTHVLILRGNYYEKDTHEQRARSLK
jgi:hypothetical protein